MKKLKDQEKNKKYTIDEIIDQNRCWSCECELEFVSKEKYSCPKCGDVYFSCKDCEAERQGAPLSCDAEINEKGNICWKCGHHFCIACWQNADFDFEGDDRTGNGWMCNECLDEQKRQRALKKKKKHESRRHSSPPIKKDESSPGYKMAKAIAKAIVK